jgi:hypothetical protein
MRKTRYSYQTKGKARLEPYSGTFESEYKALLWYNKYGKWLEKEFNRKLILVRTDDYIKKRKLNYDIMGNILNPGAPESSLNQAKMDKEKVSKKESTKLQRIINKIKSNGEETGIENPCAFGKFNDNFNKEIN